MAWDSLYKSVATNGPTLELFGITTGNQEDVWLSISAPVGLYIVVKVYEEGYKCYECIHNSGDQLIKICYKKNNAKYQVLFIFGTNKSSEKRLKSMSDIYHSGFKITKINNVYISLYDNYITFYNGGHVAKNILSIAPDLGDANISYILGCNKSYEADIPGTSKLIITDINNNQETRTEESFSSDDQVENESSELESNPKGMIMNVTYRDLSDQQRENYVPYILEKNPTAVINVNNQYDWIQSDMITKKVNLVYTPTDGRTIYMIDSISKIKYRYGIDTFLLLVPYMNKGVLNGNMKYFLSVEKKINGGYRNSHSRNRLTVLLAPISGDNYEICIDDSDSD